jgi:ligand-binding sensor domain-containing protein
MFSQNWIILNRQNSLLPSNIVSNIVQDKDGIYWIATTPEWQGGNPIGGGLARFDGMNWQIFNTTNSSLPSNNIQWVAIDSSNNIWTATMNGLAKYNRSTWDIYNTSNSPIPSNELVYVSCENGNTIWIGTYNNGVVKYNGTNWTIFTTGNSLLCQNQINFIVPLSNQVKWIGSDYGCLNSYNDTLWLKHGKGPFSPNINSSILAYNKDHLDYNWVSGVNSSSGYILAKFKDTSWIFYDSSNIGFKPKYSYNGIGVDKNDLKWFASWDGLVRYDGATWFLYSKNNSPIPANTFGAIFIDNRNNKIMPISDIYRNKYHGLALFNEIGVILSAYNNKGNVVDNFFLFQNYPNPFNPTTSIRFTLYNQQFVSLKIFDIIGREITTLINEIKTAGTYNINFNGENLSNGIYFCLLTTKEYNKTIKMVLIK